MWTINSFLSSCFDAVFAPMQSWPGWLSLTVFAVVTGIAAMVAYKYTSNQTAIGQVRDDIKASLLAMKLYKDELGVTFRSQARLFTSAAKLFVYSLVPLAVMIVPMMLLIFQMGLRYEWRPLEPGERMVLEVCLRDDVKLNPEQIQLEVPDGVVVEAGPIPAQFAAKKDYENRNAMVWRLVSAEPGNHVLRITAQDEVVEKALPVGTGRYSKVCPERSGQEYWGFAKLLYAGEKPAAKGDVIQRVHFDAERYDVTGWPAGTTPIFGQDIHWIISYFVISMIAALLVKPFLKVRI